MKKQLSDRANWQTVSGEKALAMESSFLIAFKKYFKENKELNEYEIVEKPKNFVHSYENIILSWDLDNKVYNPGVNYRHGFVPDYAIKNNKSGKMIFIEVKRQDGWVENKPRSAGRGNAHERSSKYFTPGMQKILRKESKITSTKLLPIWVVFIGDITRDPKRTREVTFWYDEYVGNYFFWNDEPNSDALISHFNKYIIMELD